nr:arginyltransferase [Lysobacter pythonis]
MREVPANHHDIRLFQTSEYICGYWRDRPACDLVIEPGDPRLPDIYAHALELGFRRTGDLIFSPNCHGCRLCVAVRIPVAHFRPNRGQRRNLRRNVDLATRVIPAVRGEEHFALYRRYLQSRHRGGGMENHGPAQFDQFLSGTWSDTRFLEVRRRREHGLGELLAVAVTDRLPQDLSAVYTFYDPAETARGLGTFCVLRQVDWARREGRRHLYLGYWIAGHPKMDYKRRFRPLDGYDGQRWRPLEYTLPEPP